MNHRIWIRVVDAWRYDRYADPDGASRPGAGGWTNEEIVRGRGAFFRAFVAGARAARLTGHRGHRAREWALRFAWATVAPRSGT